jgi:hypothetical protein
MASNNRVFVSPGVYTSEVDLTFVAQSVGVTTLGLAGETLQGPAFEPILVSDFDTFKLYFGGTSPEKFGDGNPKYELPYVAKSYLQESNQLFVTRVLGLTGFKPANTFGIKTIGGVVLENVSTGYTLSHWNDADDDTGLIPTVVGINDITAIYGHLSGVTAHDGTMITDYIVKNFSGFTTGGTHHGDYFVMGLVDLTESNVTLNTEFVSPLTGKRNDENYNTKEWYNKLYHQTSPTNFSSVDFVYSYLFVWNTGSTKFDVYRYSYDAVINRDYHDVVVSTIRPRGRYSNQVLIHEVTDVNDLVLSAVNGYDMEHNPLGEFNINVTGVTGEEKEFTVSLNPSDTKFITKVLGTEVFDKDFGNYPVYVNEVYSNYLVEAYNRGYIRGINLDVSYEDEGDNFLSQWDTTISPMVVSEVRGGKVDDLFQVITISDGETANFQVKITVQNINLDTMEFDLLVRDFNDTDENQVVLEKYSRCSMNPDMPGYIAKKIGTSDGEYTLISKRIMLTMADGAPTDAIPAGFKGFANNKNFGMDNDTLGNVIFKTEYYNAGDVVTYDLNGSPNIEGGDKVRKVMLGLSSTVKFDKDLLKFKGSSGSTYTTGFHLSTNASSITYTYVFPNTTGTTLYKTFQTTPYDLEGQDPENNNGDNKLTNINYRKFTFAVYGGHDGWDIYRNVRTNGDGYIYGKSLYKSGHTGNGGVFFGGTTALGANSDYYAYLQGIQTYSNPEAIDINVFATPGINFQDHVSLINQAIDMIETDRADSLYVMNSPNITGPTSPDDVVGILDYAGIDSNYSATYWPWIQVTDTDNATQIYIPPTGEVVRNIALTDNVSYPWFAVAGYSRGLVNAIKATKKLTLDDRDNLYKNRINPIATFSDTGTIIWGNKTLQVRESALDRINVRRLLLRARKLISAVSVRLLFEQNDDQVRNEFLRLVNPILDSIKKERGLYDFRVTVSNAPEDIDANTMRGKIYIKPTRSLEFIDVEFVVTPTGASFENI